MKLVRKNSRPISADTGLFDIKKLAEQSQFPEPEKIGVLENVNTKPAYIEHLLTYVNASLLKPLKIVCNAGNGGAGPAIDLLEPHLPFELIKVHHQPDGHFPNGVPNPMLEQNRYPTAAAIAEHQADIGIAWDGDFDRCFFFDENGRFIEGYYIVGLLAQTFLEREAGAKIVHDPRLTWNTLEVVQDRGGEPVLCKSGHAFIKEVMRREDAAYGGEMSAHHYFRDFFYCDSGMVPWLLVLEQMSATGKPLSQLVDERMEAFPASGEINSTVEDAEALLEQIEALYAPGAVAVDHTDGLSIEFADWRFNIRMSNTEPLVRLNVESRGDKALMQLKTDKLLALIRA